MATVHPRVCGADLRGERVIDFRRGSPPRVRGRRLAEGAHSRSPRFTPACAGQTARASASRKRCAVHPRVCGADFERKQL